MEVREFLEILTKEQTLFNEQNKKEIKKYYHPFYNNYDGKLTDRLSEDIFEFKLMPNALAFLIAFELYNAYDKNQFLFQKIYQIYDGSDAFTMQLKLVNRSKNQDKYLEIVDEFEKNFVSQFNKEVLSYFKASFNENNLTYANTLNKYFINSETTNLLNGKSYFLLTRNSDFFESIECKICELTLAKYNYIRLELMKKKAWLSKKINYNEDHDGKLKDISEDDIYKEILKIINNAHQKEWKYAFIKEDDFKWFVQLLTDFYLGKVLDLPTFKIKTKPRTVTRLTEAIGDTYRIHGRKNLVDNKDFLNIVKVLDLNKEYSDKELVGLLQRKR